MGVGITIIIKNLIVKIMGISKKELYIGIKIERKEHGFNLRISRKIAMDHIKEFSRYYTDKKYGLIAIEKRVKRLKLR